MNDTATPQRKPGSRSPATIVAICFVIIVFDGYDLVVYGATLPSLLAYEQWELSPGQAGAIGSYALIGMLLGALLSGWLVPRIGARKTILLSVTTFSVLMGLAALAPNPEVFGLLRFLAGLGLGGVVPTVIALTVEYSPVRKRQFNNALMFSGYSVGGMGAALAALAMLPELSFRYLYALGMLPIFVVVPLAWAFLPESLGYLRSLGRTAEADQLADRYGLCDTLDHSAEPSRTASLRDLVTGPRRLSLVFMVLAAFCGLLLVYGVNTWLPNIMRQAGYSLGSSLSFLLVLNMGAIFGALVFSRLADRFGSKPVTGISFLLAVGSILVLSLGFSLPIAMAAVAVAGMGTVGTQILVAGYAAAYFPDHERSRALALVLGLGRVGAIFGPVLGGWIAASSLAVEWNFYVFAGFALLGSLAIVSVRSTRVRTSDPQHGVTESQAPQHKISE
ncbi:aromatic acid/H+ symport family MFS transporter [Rhodococcoides fascians A21d2]|uniref:MFS transporter n=1 Tax=Rhodococcoides fascians TaxID=1828 RepID=UPI00068F1D61|nr:aromatic acid/H+ symport family MFS transporter [Rhodococcus fascians]QII00315.1 aromatic acid/H+ symport family MFS transporter [Rhodococcus fascians A21d2]